MPIDTQKEDTIEFEEDNFELEDEATSTIHLEKLVGRKMVHGTSPPNLIEKIIRERIYESVYWKQHCFALDAVSILEKAVELNTIGGVYGNQKPTEFICLALKLLHLAPPKEIIYEYIDQNDFKYVKALGMFILRLLGDPKEIYEKLEPLRNNYLKLRQRSIDGSCFLTHVDELADELLREDRIFGVVLPRIPKREVLVELEELGPYESRISLDEIEGHTASNKIEV